MNGENELPEGWISIKIPEICEINPKKPSRDSIPSDTPVTFIPMPAVDADMGAITEPERRKFGEVRNGFTFFQDGDVIFAKITPCMENGKAAIARNLINGLGFGSTEFFTLRSNGTVVPEYIYHFIRQESFRKAAEENMTGSVGQKRVPKHFIENSIIPLPPLAEQRRIIAAVEQLLARVNASRERFDRMPGLIKAFRQAVLAAACSGRLTEGWRGVHPDIEPASNLVKSDISNQKKKKRAGRLWGAGIIPKLTEIELNSLPLSWIWVTVHDLGEDLDNTVQVGPMSMQSKTFTDTGVPVLNVGCIQLGYIDASKLNFMPNDLAEKFSRYKILENDILFTRSGTVGRCAIASNKQNGFLMTFHLLRVRTSLKKCLPKYLQFVFWGAPTIKRQTEGGVIGSTREGFNTNLLANLNVPLPPLPEQHEIVRRVEALFALADHIEQRVATGKERADRLTQAILAKAFRGELVPTEAELARMEGRSYEPASVLLERIRKERSGETIPKTRRGKRKSGVEN